MNKTFSLKLVSALSESTNLCLELRGSYLHYLKRNIWKRGGNNVKKTKDWHKSIHNYSYMSKYRNKYLSIITVGRPDTM